MASAKETAVCYTTDTRASQFTVQAFASGLISVVAHSPKIAVRDWKGEVRFVPGSLHEASLRVSAKTISLEVLDELRDSDFRQLQNVMQNEVLESPRYPDFGFESTDVGVDKLKEDLFRVNVTGRLTLHGVTNSQSFFAQVALSDTTLRAYGEFTVLQTDYGLSIASIAGGTLKLQDQLKCSFYVVGRKQE
jgi:polyisoprenoid-binding protein YceI